MSSILDRCAEIEAEEARKRAETRDKRIAQNKVTRKRGRKIAYALKGGNEQWREIADLVQVRGFIERNNRRYSIVALAALEIAVLNYSSRARVSYSYTKRKEKQDEIL